MKVHGMFFFFFFVSFFSLFSIDLHSSDAMIPIYLFSKLVYTHTLLNAMKHITNSQYSALAKISRFFR